MGQLSGAPRTLTTRPRVSLRLTVPPPEEPKDSSLPSDEELMASFQKRLDDEGGATRFRLKTDASSALEEVKGVGDGIKSSVGKIFDAGSSIRQRVSFFQLDIAPPVRADLVVAASCERGWQ